MLPHLILMPSASMAAVACLFIAHPRRSALLIDPQRVQYIPLLSEFWAHVQSEVAAKKAMVLVTARSISSKAMPLTTAVNRIADILMAVLSSHPMQTVRNAAYYAMQHLLDCLKVCSQGNTSADGSLSACMCVGTTFNDIGAAEAVLRALYQRM